MADWIKTAKVGDKVVCVSEFSKSEQHEPWETFPVLGGVYTIRDIFPRQSGIYLVFEEIVNPKAHYGDSGFTEAKFSARRFRPVTPRKTDISVFERMLKTVGEPIEERV